MKNKVGIKLDEKIPTKNLIEELKRLDENGYTEVELVVDNNTKKLEIKVSEKK